MSYNLSYESLVDTMLLFPRLIGGDYCLRHVRQFVCPSVRIFSTAEILHEVVTVDRLKSDILRFWKNVVRSLGAQKGSKSPKMAKSDQN